MYERANWDSITAQADEALTNYLREQGMELNLSTFPREFRKRLDKYFRKREKDLLETTYSFVLRDVLEDKGYNDLSDGIIRGALDRLFAVTQTNWALEGDTLQTLKKLEADGYRMGLISNAGDDEDVQQLARRFGIAQYFDFILTSAACSYRKPHRRIFELALSNWYFLPSEAVMVGDNLDADVRGAQSVGLYAIWISRRAA
jgi:HAD superfamily hydrolase (TIGR01549 family)